MKRRHTRNLETKGGLPVPCTFAMDVVVSPELDGNLLSAGLLGTQKINQAKLLYHQRRPKIANSARPMDEIDGQEIRLRTIGTESGAVGLASRKEQ